MAGNARGIGNLGGIRRPPPARHLLQLYRSNAAFQAMLDFVVLGSLTLAFLEPQMLLHPFKGGAATAPQQQAAPPTPTSSPPPAAATAPQRQPAAPPVASAPAARPATPSKQGEAAPPPPGPVIAVTPVSDSARAIANLKALPPWPAIPVMPATTPGLHDVPIGFSNLVLGAPHPVSRVISVDDRAFVNLPFQLRETVKAALAARADQDPEQIRNLLKDVESPEGTPDLLIGLSYLINANAELTGLAEKSYRTALQKGQPQAPVLLGLLLTSGAKGLSGTADEGKALIEAASGNDRVAWLAIGNSYLNGESGSVDPMKAAPWIIKAAEAGEPVALLQYARLAADGIGMEKNPALAEGALRRAAEAGLTDAEDTLGRWILAAYEKKAIEDPSEGIKLEERVVAKNLVFAMNTLGRIFTFAARPPWKDESRGTKLLQACAEYRLRACQNNLGLSLQNGRGLERDPVAAWARYDVGRQLPGDSVMQAFATLDKILTPTEKEEAHKQSKEIMARLKPVPLVIVLRRDR